MADTTPPEVQLALGRLFRMLSRPYQQGDDDDYMACRSIILNSGKSTDLYTVSYARDHNKGAA